MSAWMDQECCLIATDWNQFRKLQSTDFESRMKLPSVVADGRRCMEYFPSIFSKDTKNRHKRWNKVTYVKLGSFIPKPNIMGQSH